MSSCLNYSFIHNLVPDPRAMLAAATMAQTGDSGRITQANRRSRRRRAASARFGWSGAERAAASDWQTDEVDSAFKATGEQALLETLDHPAAEVVITGIKA